jgi:hypothetical protein
MSAPLPGIGEQMLQFNTCKAGAKKELEKALFHKLAQSMRVRALTKM